MWSQWIGEIWPGMWVTVKLTLYCSLIAISLGSLLAVASISEHVAVRSVARVYVDLMRSIPVLALLIFVYFGVGKYGRSLGLSPFTVSMVVIGLSTAAYLAEVYRGTLRSIPRSQWNAAASLGLGRVDTLSRVIIPQVIAPSVPTTLNIVIATMKTTALASIISVQEATFAANTVVSESFQPLKAFVLLGLMYVVIIVPLSYLTRGLEAWISRRNGISKVQQMEEQVLADV